MHPVLRWLRPSPPRRARPVRRRLGVEWLEDRVVPAFNLQISTLATVDAPSTFDAGSNTTTFTAAAIGANLDVADIRAELAAGRNVAVTTGTAGGENGAINWLAGADLDFDGIGSGLSLTLATDATGLTRDIAVAADVFDSAAGDDALALALLPGGTGGTLTVTGAWSNLGSVRLEAGTGGVTVGNNITDVVGPITIRATGGIALGGVLSTGSGAITVDVVVVRNATAKNSLQITVLPNGGPGTVQVGQLVVNGNFGRITAPTTSFVGDGDELLTVTGKLGKLTALELENGAVTFAAAGRLKAQLITEVSLTTPGRIAALKANGIGATDLTAKSLGSLRVQRNAAVGLAGDLIDSTLSLTGRFGPRKEGLSSVVVDGLVALTRVDVLAGNVGSFVVGRFADSALFVGYTPPVTDFNDLGTFTGNFIVRSFRTTVVRNDFVPPGFDGSQVVAAKLGRVRLSSVELDNGGEVFGLRVRAGLAGNVGSVRIANTGLFNSAVDYGPSATGEVVPGLPGGLAAQGDFRFFG